MNEKKILIVNEEQNNVLESKIKKLLEGVGIGADKFDLYTPCHNRLLGGEELPPCYSMAIITYLHSEEEIMKDAQFLENRYHTLFMHGFLTGRLGSGNIGVLYRPGTIPFKDTRFAIEARTDSDWAWKIKLLNRLRDSGFEIDEAKFIELAKSV